MPVVPENLPQGIAVERNGPVLTVLIDRPDGNLLTMDMCRALSTLLLDPPDGAHVLVLTAAGDAFCLGRERSAVSHEDLPGEVRQLISLNEALSRTRLVTIARVQGDAAGFGAGLAALCDVAVAVETARFSFPEVRIDLAPTLVLAWLPRLVGRRTAFWLTATGEQVHGSDLVKLGFVNEVTRDGACLDDAVLRRVSALTDHSPRVHAEIRSMLRASAALSEEQAYDLSADRLVVGSLRRRTN